MNSFIFYRYFAQKNKHFSSKIMKFMDMPSPILAGMIQSLLGEN